jgi:hypothetical protein
LPGFPGITEKEKQKIQNLLTDVVIIDINAQKKSRQLN